MHAPMPWSSTIAPISSAWRSAPIDIASAMAGPEPRRQRLRPPKPAGGAGPSARASQMEVELAVADADLTDSEAVRRLHMRGRAMLARPNVRRLRIDLRHVAAADSKVVACLVALHRLARSRNAAMDVSIAPALRDVFVLFRLERLVPEPCDASSESKSA
jgi:ABC-type transporter Mla MlaB component